MRDTDPDIFAAALLMSLEECADVLTWTDEPELLDGPRPGYTRVQVAAARLKSRWNEPPSAAMVLGVAMLAYWRSR